MEPRYFQARFGFPCCGTCLLSFRRSKYKFTQRPPILSQKWWTKNISLSQRYPQGTDVTVLYFRFNRSFSQQHSSYIRMRTTFHAQSVILNDGEKIYQVMRNGLTRFFVCFFVRVFGKFCYLPEITWVYIGDIGNNYDS
jgi:hypothetical protein